MCWIIFRVRSKKNEIAEGRTRLRHIRKDTVTGHEIEGVAGDLDQSATGDIRNLEPDSLSAFSRPPQSVRDGNRSRAEIDTDHFGRGKLLRKRESFGPHAASGYQDPRRRVWRRPLGDGIDPFDWQQLPACARTTRGGRRIRAALVDAANPIPDPHALVSWRARVPVPDRASTVFRC